VAGTLFVPLVHLTIARWFRLKELCMKRTLLVCALLLVSGAAFAQQEYVPRYDVYAGFAYLNSPGLNLAERGFNGEFGLTSTTG
jgi:hypothetical protein